MHLIESSKSILMEGKRHFVKWSPLYTVFHSLMINHQLICFITIKCLLIHVFATFFKFFYVELMNSICPFSQETFAAR